MFRQILKIDVTDAKHLTHTFRVPAHQISEVMYIPWYEVSTIGLSTMSIESKKEGKQRIFTVKITFVADSFPLDHLDCVCFRLMTVRRKSYLVGDARPPYCLIETTENFPGRMAESSQKQYTVTWKSLLPPVLFG